MNRSERESEANTEAQVQRRAERSEGRTLKIARSFWTVASLLGPLSASLIPSLATADTIAYDSIPTSKLPPNRGNQGAPDHIAATEKLSGFYPAVTPAADVKRIEEHGEGTSYVVVFPTEAQAKSFAARGGYPSDEGYAAAGSCMSANWSTAQHAQFGTYIPAKYKPGSPEALAFAKAQQQSKLAQAKREAEDRARRARMGQRMPSAINTAKKPATPTKASTVVAIRTTHFNPGADDNASFEVVDVWFDKETLGVRLNKRSVVPFRRLATGMGGLGIYATRDGSDINFFITPPKIPEVDGVSDATLRSLSNRLIAQLPQGSTSASECGYLNINLKAEAGSGQMASILATEFLPPQPDEDAPPSDGSENNENGESSDFQSVTSASRAVRTRPLLANLSISQLLTESAPIISVTFGWAGPDQQQRF
jgi:hypothetical protein